MVKEKDQRERKKELGQDGKHRNKLIVIGIFAGIIVAIAYVSYDLDKAPKSTAQVIDGIECNPGESVILHNHVRLDVFVNGNSVPVSAQIGIVDNTCLYWMHTHSTNGVLHIESPKSRESTLGEFIDIWKATKEFPISGTTPKIFVNGQAVSSSLNETKINEHDEIAIAYGNVSPKVPSFYQFSEGE